MHIKRRKGKAGEGRKISRKADKEDKALLKPRFTALTLIRGCLGVNQKKEK